MDDRQYEEIRDLVKLSLKESKENRHDIKEIKMALLGAPQYEVKGIAQQVAENTEHIVKHKSNQKKAEGVRAVLAVIAGFVAGNVKDAWRGLVELITS